MNVNPDIMGGSAKTTWTNVQMGTILVEMVDYVKTWCVICSSFVKVVN